MAAIARPNYKQVEYDNRLEYAYALYLDERKALGEIQDWYYHPLRLVLAERTTYEPDFLVIANGGFLELHETKGFWRDDARVKIKVAARQCPYFKFIAVEQKKKQWLFEEIPQ